MEDQESSLFQARKAKRIEQMVARWLRRSRDNLPRSRVSVTDCTSGSQQFTAPVKVTTVIHKDLFLNSYGFDISQNHPLAIASVISGGPADGKLVPGDQILKIHNQDVEDLSVEQVVDLIGHSEDAVHISILRYPAGPKSSFLTAEKRARLKCNPVKVRFAEEIIVNGHAQGNSLLFMPNVLKVYLENGQTKAFKFEKKTTVKDIILTLKEKLSINMIEHFALALEEQYNIAKLYLLHEDELIEQVVQKRESHDYRCLFRVCFVPRDPWDLLQEDPVAFEYLYLQSCSDVLQERFAVEMKCSVALRLAALHIQERIFSCAQPQKISMKYIEKDWGIENFISPTLLRNMRGKDIKKAINFHMKRNQALLEPRQKPLSAAQVRLNYLKILGELKTYGGKIFNATLLLQDRESHVSLLVGAKHGISQIVNNKLNIMTTLAEFANISRIELSPESEKVSMMKVYLQDVKPLTLLLESNNGKDLACLIAGYYKLFVDSGHTIFAWNSDRQIHRISAEEGYESRVCSDSEESTEFESSLEFSSDFHHLKCSGIKPLHEEEEEEEFTDRFEQEGDETEEGVGEMIACDGSNIGTDSASEVSVSATAESQGCKISWSSDSIDALEEDDLEACSSSRPEFFQFYTPCLNEMDSDYPNVFSTGGTDVQTDTENGKTGFDPLLCFLQCSPLVSDSVAVQQESLRCLGGTEQKEENEPNTFTLGCRLYDNNIMEYYSICSSISPASSVERTILSSTDSCSSKDLLDESEKKNTLNEEGQIAEVETLILSPPPGFGDSSSEEEFFDAAERLTPTQPSSGSNLACSEEETRFNFQISGSCNDQEDANTSRQHKKEQRRMEKESNRPANAFRKRRSYLQTDYTSQVTFPVGPAYSLQNADHVCCYESESYLSSVTHAQTVPSFKDTEGEPALLETKSLSQVPLQKEIKSKSPSPTLMEMEPDTMETKSVTDTIISSISATRVRTEQDADGALDLDLPSTSFVDNLDAKHRLAVFPCVYEQKVQTSSSEVYFRLEEDHVMKEGAGVLLVSLPGYCLTTDSLATAVVEHEQKLEEVAGSLGTDKGETSLKSIFLTANQNDILNPSVKLSHDAMEWCAGRQPVHIVSSEGDCTTSNDGSIESEKKSNIERNKPDLTSYVIKKNETMISNNTNCKDVNEESLQKDVDQKCLGLSNPAELLFDLNGISGILTCFSQSLFEGGNGKVLSCQDRCTQHTGKGDAFTKDSETIPKVQTGHIFKEEGQQNTPSGKDCGYLLAMKPSQLGHHQGSEEKEHSSDLLQIKCGLQLPPKLLAHFSGDDSTTSRNKGHKNASLTLETFSEQNSITGPMWENSNFIPYCSDQSPICCSPDMDKQPLLSPNSISSLDFSNTQDASLPKVGEENCSCRFSYASCFRGLDAEVDDESIDSEQSISSLPMTTPPSSGSLLSVDSSLFDLTDARKEAKSPLNNVESIFTSQCHFETLDRLEGRTLEMANDFGQLQNHVVDLQKTFETYSGSALKHPEDKCTVHFCKDKQALCGVSRKLMSSCQKVINVGQTPKQIQNTLQDTFQKLIDLTRVCLQFTGCNQCSRRQIAVLTNLKDVAYTYHQFVQAARNACEKDCSDLSLKLLSRQCTALTAATFCLTQQFRTLTSV
ncbi:FERM and PDZ domain-containing protein 1 isoform X2 [Ambystoma mexicanum]|uniref:FERM and PDZ domain-containing protein 1 isoform X2 n=1 Tax=Ambystoma mexicanum TaxID=8296 RepID=UPI0037E81119